MKKKKKSKSKKAAFDLDAFEKDLKSDGTSTPQGGGDDGEDGEVPDGDYKPDGDLGDDPFAANDDDEAGLGEEKELKMDWLGSDRDYTYQEVSLLVLGNEFLRLRRGWNFGFESGGIRRERSWQRVKRSRFYELSRENLIALL